MKTQNFGYKKLYINGKLVDAADGQKEDVVCPATGEVIAQVAKAGKADAEAAGRNDSKPGTPNQGTEPR